MSEWLLLSLLGGLLALDGTSVGQFMLSRPLVAGTATGLLLGAPAEGFLVGGLLELYLIVSVPVGGARFPEGGPATVVAAAVAAAAPGGGGLAAGFAIGLIWGQVASFSVTGQRFLNTFLVPAPEAEKVSQAALVGGHLAAISLDFLRGMLVTASGLWLGDLILRATPQWPLSEPDTRGLLLVGAAVSLGILLRTYGGARRRAWLLAAGVVGGVLGGTLL